MRTLLQTLFFFLLVSQICFSQWKDETNIPKQINDVLPIKPHNPTHTFGKAPVSLHPSFYDRKADWQWIIDSTWGLGEALSGKLATFDTYQNYARAYNATFVWNPVDWDSLAPVLRSRITDSTSRGEFARILNDLAFGMKDGHAYAYNDVVLYTPLNPGTPILADGSSFINHFGAGLTPLSDSTLLVYKVVPNHPLGLEPGDIILGYQGVLWHQIVTELLDGGIPHTLYYGAAPSAFDRILLMAAGESWHMFDTIDVVKYTSGLTEHLPLDQMVNLVVPSNYINNEQLPVPGVPMPTGIYPNPGAVTYGIIDGTNIGYIYVYHHFYSAVSTEFDAAVLALMQTDGLIIDIRLNWGGSYGLKAGISRIINYPTSTLDMKARCNPNELFLLCPGNQSWWDGGVIPADVGTYYDRPVAVLLGPNCVSYGDYSSWQLSYIPNAKMFGRSPSAVYSGYGNQAQPYRNGYTLQCPNLTLVDHYAPNVPRWGQEYPFLEEVWLTPDGVANGEDDVVKRALEWMNNLVYAHKVASEKTYYAPEEDSVHISTIIENPNSHQVSARGYLKTLEGVLIDSVDLVHQLLNPVGEQWTANFDLPTGEDFYDISVTAFDNTNGDQFATPNATRFTTAGPLKMDSVFYQRSSNIYAVKPYVTNAGTSMTISGAKIRLYCDDPWITSITTIYAPLPNIAPGATVNASSWVTIYVIDSLFPGYLNFTAEIMKDGWPYWTDTLRFYDPGWNDVEDELNPLPSEFLLSQNYPNPFNNTCAIKYSIPKSSQVTLKIFNTLGEEIETLVNEEKPVGTYELNWNAANLPSGVYFYQLKAGNFVQTRKMILLK